jgi:ribosome-associated protein
MSFRRAIHKKEKADMGKLKNSVRGLVVVHQMTELGRELGLKDMTGFANTVL